MQDESGGTKKGKEQKESCCLNFRDKLKQALVVAMKSQMTGQLLQMI